VRDGSPPSIQEQARSQGYYTLEEAAQKAGISYRCFRRYIKRGIIFPRTEIRDDAPGIRYWLSEADISRAREMCEYNLKGLKFPLRDYIIARRTKRRMQEDQSTEQRGFREPPPLRGVR